MQIGHTTEASTKGGLRSTPPGGTFSAMGHPAARRATYDDLLALPEHVVGEILNGELLTQARPAARHARASGRIERFADEAFGEKLGPGGWVILREPELHIEENVLVPDVAGWRREHMPQLLDVTAFELVPDWVCEVLSPSTAVKDRTQKMPIYASIGVHYAWLVDPILRTLEAFRLDGGGWRVVGMWGEDAVVRVEPFEACELKLASLWGP